jgi:hypothetical protein
MAFLHGRDFVGLEEVLCLWRSASEAWWHPGDPTRERCDAAKLGFLRERGRGWRTPCQPRGALGGRWDAAGWAASENSGWGHWHAVFGWGERLSLMGALGWGVGVGLKPDTLRVEWSAGLGWRMENYGEMF